MTEPNTALRTVRASLLLSQDELARAVREAGRRAGEPNECSKRLVQRWEAGTVRTPRGAYARALEVATGQPLENLGFKTADERYGLSRRETLGMAAAIALPLTEGEHGKPGALSGIWISTYTFVSSGRGNKSFTNHHHVVVLHRGDRVQVRSLPATAPGDRLMMDLTVNGQVLTGTWTEHTEPDGYYKGAVYHGAIQMLLDPTGHRMAGQWAGFGKEFDVNTGPWSLRLVTTDTSKEAMAEYNRPVLDKPGPVEDQAHS